MAFRRIPLGSETGGWGGESSRYAVSLQVGGLSTGRFAIRNEFQDEVAWSLLALLPAHTPSSQATWQPWAAEPHTAQVRPRCRAIPTPRTPCGRGSQQIVQGSFEGEVRGGSPVGMMQPQVTHHISIVQMYLDHHHQPSTHIFNEMFFAFLMPSCINYPVMSCSDDA